MYDWSAINAYEDKSKSKIQVCPECGCTMQVTVMLQDGHNEMEEYSCPNKLCDHIFSVRACITPEVKLIKYQD